MTATKSALEDIHPSTTAPARPERLTRLKQRRRSIFRRERKGDIRGSVGRVVVDNDHLPRHAVESDFDAFEKNRNVGQFSDTLGR